MTIDTAPKVVALYRYPVKGLSAQPLEQVTLTAGETIAFDRA
ncbi:MAG: MOSC N-terminal beta barrel domain-containing protein, partial [Alphaproteobacteria bacterium]|nr:MOSC N-terminal beta barrel domain-containing protein [Alphaproteobacteria bacterium]